MLSKSQSTNKLGEAIIFLQELFENTWERLLIVSNKWASPRLFKRNKDFLLIVHRIAVLHYFRILYFVTFVLSARKTQAGLGSQWKNPGLKSKKKLEKNLLSIEIKTGGREREREREFKKQREKC